MRSRIMNIVGYSPTFGEGKFSEVGLPFNVVLTAGFSEHDPSRMMHICGLDEGFV